MLTVSTCLLFRYATPENGTALSLKAGTDMDCGDWGAHAYLNELPKALAQGLVEEADLDRSLIRLTKLQMDLGLFDPKEKQPYFNYGYGAIPPAITSRRDNERARATETEREKGGGGSACAPS